MSRTFPGMPQRSAVSPGTWLVVGLLLLGVAAAVAGIWFQRQQTRRCLDFYGAAAARRISTAPHVELLLLEPGSAPRRLRVSGRLDVSQAAGLVHLRRGLVEDANFRWPEGGAAATPERLPLDSWDVAMVFSTAGVDGESEALVVDFDRSGGAIAVVGRPGRIGLGRLGAGLEKWMTSTLGPAISLKQGQKTVPAR